MSQTAVAAAPKIGLPGEPGDMQSAKNGRVDSRTSEEASAEIRTGIMVQAGTGDFGAKILTATTNKLVGITTRSHDFGDLELGDTGYKPGATFGTARSERWFVRIEENVTPASDVRVRCVAAGAEIAGAFRATADSTDCIDITPCAKWVRTSLAADGIGEVEIDMSGIELAVADI
jgi:hypothetical protein